MAKLTILALLCQRISEQDILNIPIGYGIVGFDDVFY